MNARRTERRVINLDKTRWGGSAIGGLTSIPKTPGECAVRGCKGSALMPVMVCAETSHTCQDNSGYAVEGYICEQHINLCAEHMGGEKTKP